MNLEDAMHYEQYLAELKRLQNKERVYRVFVILLAVYFVALFVLISV